jgi:hypothetical protein
MESGEIGSFGGESRGGSIPEKGSNPVTSLIQEQRQKLILGDINQYYDMWSDMTLEKREQVSEAEYKVIKNVSLGLGFLFYDQLRDMKKAVFLVHLAHIRKDTGTDRVIMPYADAKMLQLAAAAVNVAYDTGREEDTPENVVKRTFTFTAVEHKAPNVQLPEYLTKGLDISHWSNKRTQPTNVVPDEK